MYPEHTDIRKERLTGVGTHTGLLEHPLHFELESSGQREAKEEFQAGK